MRLSEATKEHDRLRQVRRPIAHDSAVKHVTGAAIYVDDIREPAGTLHCAAGLAQITAGRITGMDLTAVKEAPGVVTVLTAADIAGANDVSAKGIGDDPVLAVDQVRFFGQVMFLVVARTRDQARRAARLGKIATAPSMPLIDVDDAIAAGSKVLDDYSFGRGDPSAEIAAAQKKITSIFRMGGQEHFYLEGQAALAIPGEGGEMLIHSSTQHPSEVQHVVAHMLGKPQSMITVEVRRMGGGFGGKESQATQWAALAALAAAKTGRPCKMRLDRDDDMLTTGKRHDFRVDYTVGVGPTGLIRGVDVKLTARCGHSEDLSLGVVDRSMFHADNSYYYPAVKVMGRRMRTNTVSNTAFRGFGGPQGMLFAERMMDDIAYALGIDPLDVRVANFYGGAGRDRTPYGMRVEDNCLQELVGQLEKSSDYRKRRKEITEFNAASPILKRGLALTPVKFGISFTLIPLNQAGALVHLYKDGSIHLNHGGTEMGQGLFIKVAQVVAEEFGVDLDQVSVSATSTAKVPNTGPTAASAGSDLNGMAALAACRTIKDRLYDLIREKWQVPRDKVEFRDGQVIIGNRAMKLAELAEEAWKARVSLSSTGFYKTPKIEWDREKATGRPFFYFAYGAACSEVILDTMTGEMRVSRVDILHDVGRSLNPAVDIGQIEGGFVQGMGWLTTEELMWDSAGRLRTHAPSTYKIPVASDVPEDFRVELFNSGGNREDTIYRSKAVGEPPLMLANSVFCAIVNALSSLKSGVMPPLNAPATPESIMRAVRLLTGGGTGA
jgi:xanthine dehydrogenase large subunit